jgi:MFS family permease
LTGAFILTVPLAMLFFSRALDGITGGNVSVANAYLADITKDKDRKKNFGKMTASANLGFIVGPALAGLLGYTVFEEKLPVLAALLISLIAIFVIAARLKEINPCILKGSVDQLKTRKIMGQEIKECHSIEGADSQSLGALLKGKGILLMLILYFLTFLAFSFFYVAFPVYAVNDLGWSIFQLGVFFSVLSGAMVLVQGPVLSKLSGKYSDESLIISGSILLGLSFLFFRMESGAAIYGGALLFAAGNGIMWPSFLSVVARLGGNNQGAIQGYASSAGSLASILGLLMGGILFTQMGNLTFLIPSVLMVIIAFSSTQLIRLNKESIISN